jgi:hypothetical protein
MTVKKDRSKAWGRIPADGGMEKKTSDERSASSA